MKYMRVLFHGFFYYFSWVACVYFAQTGQAWAGPLLVLISLFLQIVWEKVTNNGLRRILLFTVAMGGLGAITDTLWLIMHLIVYKANPWGPDVASPWIISLWLSFGFNLIVLYENTFMYYKTWGMLALIGIPVCYSIGIKVGAAALLTPYFYLISGVFWAVALPLFLTGYRIKFKQ